MKKILYAICVLFIVACCYIEIQLSCKFWLEISFPFVSTHSCINGFFYGQKKAAIPAFAQIFEQLTRVTCVFLLSGYFQSRHQPVHVGIAVFGLALGEAVSMLIALTAILITKIGRIDNAKTM